MNPRLNLPLPGFQFAQMPEIHFAPGAVLQLPRIAARYGKRVLLVTGSGSFSRSDRHAQLMNVFTHAGIETFSAAVTGEPSPAFVDATVAAHRDADIACVIGIGGGSAIDAGKAISAMLPQTGSVADFLECFDTRKHDGRKTPYIAVPTSAGTGAEATKNAVLSSVGEHGYKSSLRHDRFVPDVAIVDPELARTCPSSVTAACGLDALTQLLEAYVSTKASPMTDALAESGLRHVAAGFLAAVERGGSDLGARGHMAYAALLSGITLANAGLGLVHGYAGPIGGLFDIPHGVVCGTLIGETTRVTIDALFTEPEKHAPALRKYARAGAILAAVHPTGQREDCDLLIATLRDWIERTRIPRLGTFGIRESDFPAILAKTNGKNSPAALTLEQMAAILKARL